ncbi:hypothetical protein, partial [Salmonella enterica]|uniref:hypothetical protein n=1 Tax=Salmonella enterica TaxID=28901 RepID=UPI00329819A8
MNYFKLCLAVPRGLVQTHHNVDENVLNDLHLKVIPEGVVQDVLQLFQRDSLHVELPEDTVYRISKKTIPTF